MVTESVQQSIGHHLATIQLSETIGWCQKLWRIVRGLIGWGITLLRTTPIKRYHFNFIDRLAQIFNASGKKCSLPVWKVHYMDRPALVFLWEPFSWIFVFVFTSHEILKRLSSYVSFSVLSLVKLCLCFSLRMAHFDIDVSEYQDHGKTCVLLWGISSRCHLSAHLTCQL